MHRVRIEGLGTAGDGVARLASGEVVFVDGAFPGDLVDIRLTRKQRGVQQAEVSRLVEPSADRVESRCPVDACGGCPTRWYARSGQAGAKRERVVQALRRIARLDVADLLGPLVEAPHGWRYRQRVRLHTRFIEGQWRIGYHARRSHRLVPLETCPVLSPQLEAAALLLARALSSLPASASLDQIELIASRADGAAAARISATADHDALRLPAAWFATSGLAGVEVVTPAASVREGDLALRYDHGRADEFELLAEPGVFTQANPAVNDLLVAAVLEELPAAASERVLELHAGVGNYSLPLALAGADVYTAEHQERAVLLAQANAERAGAGLHAFFLEDLDALSPGGPVPPLTGFDAVLMNPPRVGAHEVARVVAAQGPGRVVYVSCDPATLARDADVLVGGGYRLAALRAFDMFPQTPHVEVLARFDRA